CSSGWIVDSGPLVALLTATRVAVTHSHTTAAWSERAADCFLHHLRAIVPDRCICERLIVGTICFGHGTSGRTSVSWF
ncbi:MAG: hypothetical protein ACRELF_27545, partial [Gemmataceae bacterium]